MSFGFGIGDCIAVIEVVKKIHDRVKDSPDQIKNTRQDVEAISAFIKREETSRLNGITDPLNRARIHDSLASCKRIVQGLQSDLNKFKEVESGGKGLRMKLKQSVYVLFNVFEYWDQSWSSCNFWRIMGKQLLKNTHANWSKVNALNGTRRRMQIPEVAGVERLHQRLDTKDQMIERQNQVAERQAILDWICSSEIDYVDQQKALKKRRQRGIGEWFVDSQNFKNWLNADGSALLCSGRPGVGKTMITSFVVNRVLEKHNNDPQVGIAYIYCQFARQKEQTPGNLLSSILRQLVERHSVVPAKVKSLYQLSLGKEDLSPADLTDLLDIVLGSFRKRIIIIDALDEMQSSTGAQSEFVSQVLAIRQKFGIQLYVTSRTIQEIARKAPDASQMEICARDEDMRCSLANILKTGPLLSNRPDLQKRALSKILQIADGM
ncbi:hypothetical protein D6C85_06169 [Aureobasidium pullulans]|uniref:Nephrocystin 3-like N-terminal domain-containing protein n=1 Tax=Aureobasidium pullulans TaxID=5580 RepID=A0A4S9WVK7_AURPU|nr:hypothetical protein D6C85_06169 [Aureobasidium pullulans]